MKSRSLASFALVSLSIGCARGFSWDDLEDSDLYIRELDTFGIDSRDMMMNDYKPELVDRDYMDELEEDLHTRDVPSQNKRVLDNIATTKKEMFAVYKDMSKIVKEQKKKYPLTKDTGKASEEFIKTATQAKKQKVSDKKTAKKTDSKSKSSKKKDADYEDVEKDFEEDSGKKAAKKTNPKRKSSKKKDPDSEDVEPDFLHNRATLDIIADAKPNSVIRCDLLLTSFKPSSELVQTLNYAEQHLKWDQWQYMEWDLLTMQAAQMKQLIGNCNAAQIDGLSTCLNQVWMSFSKVVRDLAGLAKKSSYGHDVDEKILQLANDTVGSIAS